jgi:hypothetical protein
MLQMPAPTRWGSIQACLYSILKAEKALHCIVTDRNFVHGTAKQKDAQTRICDIVTSESFIAYLKNCRMILEPIDEMITMFQSDSAALSDVFTPFALLGPTFVALEGFHDTEKSYLFKLAKQRFDFMYGDAHGIAYLLDPRYIGDGMLLSFREGIEERIFTHHFDDKDPSLEEKTAMCQECTSLRSWAMQQRTSNSFKYQMLVEKRSTFCFLCKCFYSSERRDECKRKRKSKAKEQSPAKVSN